jgi:uncharacterized protein (DUF433 family)
VCGGKPCIDGTRIRVQDVAIASEEEGMSPDEICDTFPPISLAQVHAALAYYYDHRDEILAEIEAGKQFAEEFRRQHPDRVR